MIRLSDAERTTLQKAGAKYIAAWVSAADKDGLNGEAMLKTYEVLIAKYAAVKQSKGYPWK